MRELKCASALCGALLWCAAASAAVYSARSYVQDGLVGNYDAKENAGDDPGAADPGADAASLLLNDPAGGTFTAPADAAYTGITFGSAAGAYTLAGSGIQLNGSLVNESAQAQTVTAPLTVASALKPEVGAGLSLANVTAAGLLMPLGSGGDFTLTGKNTFAGPLVLSGNPLVVSPRVYKTSGWSKDLAGNTDPNVQVTYWLRGDGRNAFTALEDLTGGQRGDVIILEGENAFSGNVQPNGNDGYLVIRGTTTAGDMKWDNSRGHNSRLYVESGASLSVKGTFTQTGGNGAHAYVDGVLTVGAIDLRATWSSLSSPGKTGVINADSFRVTTLSPNELKDFTLNLGTGGLVCGSLKIGNLEVGARDAAGTKIMGSPIISGTTFRAATADGEAATIRLQGTPTLTGSVTKTGAGALVLAPSAFDNLTGTINVQAGRVLIGADGTLAATVNLAEGTALGVEARRSAVVPHAVFAGSAATLVFGADANGVGSLTLPPETLADASAVTIVLDGAPVAGTVVKLLSGAQLADASKFTLSAPAGVAGTLAVEDGDLVLTVTQSGAQAAKSLVWTGAKSAVWDLATANWLDGETASPFAAAMNALFNGTDAGDGSVAVDADGVEANNVTFDAAKTYTLTGGQIAGAGTVTVKGGATVVMAGATLDRQEIVVTNGILQVGAEKPGLLGDSSAWVTIRDGGTLDLHAMSKSADSQLTTHQKLYRISGAGVDDQGAIVNRGANGDPVARLHTVHLAGDATVSSTKRFDLRPNGASELQGRPQLYGPTNTLTVKGPGVGVSGQSFCLIDTDVNLGALHLVDNACINLETGSKETISNGVEIANSYLQFWGQTTPFAAPITVVEGTGRIGNGTGSTTITGLVTVADGATLNLQGGNLARTRWAGGIRGAGALKSSGDLQHLVSDVEQNDLTVAGGFVIYGDNTAAGNEKTWPKNVTMTSGYLAFAPSTNSVYSGYAISGTGGYFNPSWQGSNKTDAVSGMPLVKKWANIPVTTVENTTVEGVNIGMGLGHVSQLICQAGAATFGSGFVGRDIISITLGLYNTQPDSATLTLAAGSSVSLKADGEILLGQWSGPTNNIHRLIVDGGTLDASLSKPPRVGYDSRAAEFLVRDGTVKVKGVSLRYHTQHNMTADSAGTGYEVFSMAGGVVELDGSFTTERFYPWTPQIWLGGGTLKSLSDWNTDFYQVATFEPWGDLSGVNTFTLDTADKTVTYRSALQGNSNVRITGTGSFVADSNVQGGVNGHWTIENTGTANLKNAAAFAKGLTLKDGTSATIDIGARTNYISLAVGCMATDNLGSNQFTHNNFYNSASVFPNLFTKKPQKLLTLTPTPHYTAYRAEAEFYVDEADTYTFGVSYDDRGDILVDGQRVAFNTNYNSVGIGSVALAAGWRRLSITCKDDAGGAGPDGGGTDSKTWKAKGMAAGFHKGATTSLNAADYQPLDTTALKMRPVNSVRWSIRYIGANASIPTDWKSGRYDFSMVTNSMQKLHDISWAQGKLTASTFSGWIYVEPADAGTWAFEGVYDDGIYVEFDGKKVFENTSWNSPASSTAEIGAGWHAFRIVVCDKGGGISWNGKPDYGAALYVKRPGDAQKVPFDERSIRMTADPYGFIGGELEIGAGATLTNASDTPCELTGTVSGTGTAKGLYELSGVWNLSMDDGRTMKAVNFADGIDLRNGRLSIALATRPVSAKYTLCPVTGLDGLSQEALDAKLAVTLAGEAYERGLSLVVEDGKAVLKNLKPTGTIFYLR